MDTEIFKEAEERANKFNLRCFLVIIIIGLLVLISNEINLFPLSKDVVRNGIFLLILYYSVPLIIYLIHDKFAKKKPSILQNTKFKIIVMICAFGGVIDLCCTLSNNVLLVIVIPPLLAAQYKHDRRIFFWVIIASLITIPVITYGAYFLGVYDRLLHKGLTEEQADFFQNRIDNATPRRMLELFTHHVIPKCFCIAAIDYIAHSITKRTSFMIEKQIDLNALIVKEVETKNEMQRAVIEDLADIVETRDLETGDHIKRTKLYVNILANALKNHNEYEDILTPDVIELMTNSAPLHDIGKIGVSDLILCKKGRLTEEEFNQMKTHTTIGGQIIKRILSDLGDEKSLDMAYDIALCHHEKWNGTGYPNGLKEEEIPLSARIMAIADVFDALVSKRCYKEALPFDDAVNIIIKDAGTHFDPNIVEVFKEIIPQFKDASEIKL